MGWLDYISKFLDLKIQIALNYYLSFTATSYFPGF